MDNDKYKSATILRAVSMTAKNNDKYLSTNEAAKAFRVQPATLRTAVWRDGAYYGITPVKMPNRRLLWPANDVSALIAAHA